MGDIEKFKSTIGPFRDGWKSIDVRAVCVHMFDRWVNLGASAALSTKVVEKPKDQELLPRFGGFGVFHDVYDAAALDDLLGQLEGGVFQISDKEIHFSRIEGQALKPSPPSFWFGMNRRSDPWGLGHFSFLNIVLKAGGERTDNLLNGHPEGLTRETLDWRLRSLETPYDGLDDLFVDFLGVPKQPWGPVSESAFVQVIAPIQLRFGDGSELSAGRVTIHVEAVGYERLDGVTIGIIALGGEGELQRTSHRLVNDDWAAVMGGLVTKKEVDVGEAASVIMLLSFRGNALDRLVLNDRSVLLKNPRILAYTHFDKDLESLAKYLEGKGTDTARDFEVGVGLLLHFCGFSVGAYGLVKSIQEEIDLVAFVPSSNDLVAVECTLKDLDVNAKLSKFSRRVKELRERLSEFRIVPLAFTTLEGAKIATTDLEKAKSDRIGVVAAEQIRELLRIAGRQAQPAEILAYLYGLIPGEPGPFESSPYGGI